MKFSGFSSAGDLISFSTQHFLSLALSLSSSLISQLSLLYLTITFTLSLCHKLFDRVAGLNVSKLTLERGLEITINRISGIIKFDEGGQ